MVLKHLADEDKPFSKFRILTFDCYGTLVDWETGLMTSLAKLIEQLPDSHEMKSSRIHLLQNFQSIKRRINREQPDLLYASALEQTYIEFAQVLGFERPSVFEAQDFSASIGTWRPFTDTIDALYRLKKHYRLAIISNIDNVSFSRTLKGPLQNFPFDAVYTAEDIGAYKPSHAAFEYMFSKLAIEFGISKDENLHVAQSLIADHVPAKELGLASVWIARGEAGGHSGMGGDPTALRGQVAFSWKFATLDELALAVEMELGASST